MRLPEDLRPFQELALSLLQEESVKTIEFSGGTYQVEIDDPYLKESVWAFLQLDDKGNLKDRFCSCEGGEEVSLCPHLAAAFLALFGKHTTPIHFRFQNSFWRVLAQIAYERWGDNSLLISAKGEKIRIGKHFFCQGKTENVKKDLRGIFFERITQTEETSLKFSNLSKEEIRRWKEGRPSPQLIFELSFWNDLAKWLMLKEEKGELYTLSFEYTKEEIPKSILIEFSDITLQWTISLEELSSLVPSLAKVPSPLKVHASEEEIKSIVYDREKKQFHVILKEIDAPLKEALDEKGIALKEWIYLPKGGFYPAVPHPLMAQSIPPGMVLTDYFELLEKRLEGVSLSRVTVPIFYTVSFDHSWQLLIKGYLFEPGDLSTPLNAFFGNWVFLNSKDRFYPIEGVVFDDLDVVVPVEKVADFVRKYRIWLDHQPGFQTHINPIETSVSYTVTKDNRLCFFRKAIFEETSGHMKDFGQWVYIAGQGFFAKGPLSSSLPVDENVSIGPDQIPLFIRANKKELDGIEGFFSSQCPVEKMGLHVFLDDSGNKIVIKPEYHFLPSYQEKEVQIFDEYVYVSGQGFSQIPLPPRFPVRFFHSSHLNKDHFSFFFSNDLNKMEEFVLTIDPRIEEPLNLKGVVSLLEKDEGGNYLLTFSYLSEKGEVSSYEVIEGIKSKKQYLFSPAGRIDLDADRFHWIRGNERFKDDKLLLSPLELLRFATIDPPQIIEGASLLENLLLFKSDQEPDFCLLGSQLRSYQEQGAKWLWFLYLHQFSGLLCDDMGLGKTHQSMALMAAVQKHQKNARFLIVCPTSVIYHWEDKLAEFLPSFSVCTFHGVNRDLEKFEQEGTVLLTSYGIWRKEAKKLSKISFEVAFFDEIHAAKNQKSRIHTSLLEVSAKVKIGLTGTPIENRLRELKALFDLILPGLMPLESQFYSHFVVPIERENNPKQKALLSRLIHPFMLRRKKEEVLSDLPEKIEEIAHCELLSEQRNLYDVLLNQMRGGLIKQLEDLSSPIPFLHIFSVLSGLKQICNHPAAYLKNPQEYTEHQSGKWDLFVELVNEALESGQKVVIFSQYLAMLDIMELYFQEIGVDFATVRGSTVNRGEEVRRFNQEVKCQVFLGSLHAAGLGIDLTAGSVVIHYDRWWNAAREDQATDRVHRIGQKRGVQVFKLVTRGTFEEKIDEMIVRKGRLMEEVVGVDDYRFMKQFTREELIQLLEVDVQIKNG